MKKILSLLTMVVIVASCFVIGFAQPKRKPKRAIGAGGAGTYVRNGRRGRYVTRNGRRIWVPQGSPAVGNRRGVYEREQEAELKKRSTNTNRP